MTTKQLTAILPLLVLILTACNSAPEDKIVGTNDDEWTEKVEVAMPDGGRIVDRQHGEELWFAIAPITGVGEALANGVTQAHYFEDGTYLHNLKVNIERAKDTFFYEGWVANSENKSEWESLGHLSSHFADVRHAVQFRGEADLREHLMVKLTLEQDDGDPLPGLLVAEGVLKVTSR